ncbi:MAG: transglycosylase domain-containing protein [Candidatus Moraniibacteriota bacterium]|nr:MAG: transglycosylase domain-containing protein [Candidatus Moranbacteria bacterium]
MNVWIRKLSSAFFSIIWEGTYIVFLVGIGGMLGLSAIYFSDETDVSQLLERPLAETSVILDRTGEIPLYELHGEENRTVVGHDDIPDAVRFATVAAEDRSFYRNFGVDPISIVRALRANFQAGHIEQGASTITQQLARIAFLSREKTVVRKIREAILALKIERTFSKDQILDLYLNTVPYGSNAYGIERAAESFFGKHAKELTLDEAAFLAALPRATTHYSPYGSHRDDLRDRQESILRYMESDGFVSAYDAQLAIDANTFAKLRPIEASIRAPHFVFAVIDALEKQYGREFLETRGLRIRTTIDLSLQDAAEQSVEDGVQRNAKYDAENASLVAVDVATGDVLSMVGSRDYFDTTIDGAVNVTMRPRQPGSAFKPFVYAKAFEEGYQPETLVYDVPTNFGPDGSGRDYTPKDYDGKYRGALSMKEALPQSLNIPAVQTLAVAGVSNVIDLAQRLGISTLDDGRLYGLALVLGGAEVLPLDMASAFATFASEGIHREYRLVLSVENVGGSIHDEFPVQEKRVLNTEIARRINTILSDNSLRAPIFGANSPLAFPKGTVAAKTGTTQDFHDAWTVGYTPSIAVAVWAGNNDNSPLRYGADGVFAAAPIWRDFLDRVMDRLPAESFASYDPIPTDIHALAERFGKNISDDTSIDMKKTDIKKSKKKKKK